MASPFIITSQGHFAGPGDFGLARMAGMCASWGGADGGCHPPPCGGALRWVRACRGWSRTNANSLEPHWRHSMTALHNWTQFLSPISSLIGGVFGSGGGTVRLRARGAPRL